MYGRAYKPGVPEVSFTSMYVGKAYQLQVSLSYQVGETPG